MRAGSGRNLGPTMALVWLAFLAFPITATLAARPSTAELVATLVGTALFVAVYVRLILSRTRPLSDRRGLLCVGLLLAIASALTTGDRAAWALLFIFTAAAAGPALREQLAVAGVALCTVLAAASTLVTGTEIGIVVAFTASTAGIGMLVLSIAGLRRRNAELYRARGELARLAVADERLRFARDLHDLLGHSLSVIALKAELAGRLLDVGENVATARMHIGELEAVARKSLSELRETVSGYRQPVLALELDGARMALRAAGIEARLDRARAELDPEVEALLAWTVREGTTNVIRHSGARHCRVVIAASATAASIEVIDDGRGPDGVGPGAAGARAAGHGHAGTGDGDGARVGHGLAGLRERAERLAGDLETGVGPDGGFRLRVSVPGAGSARVAAA